MTEQEIMIELQAVLCELTGDVLALECFCCCEDSVESFGLSASAAYLRRAKGYFDQNIEEATKLASMLVSKAQDRLLLSAQNGRMPESAR